MHRLFWIFCCKLNGRMEFIETFNKFIYWSVSSPFCHLKKYHLCIATTHMALNQNFVGSFLQDQTQIKWSRVGQIFYLLQCLISAYLFLCWNRRCFLKLFQLALPLRLLMLLFPSLRQGVSSKMINLHGEYLGVDQPHLQRK